jgi:hypothetical protein
LGHRWLRLKLIGSSSNRDAIGATVSLTANGATQTRHVMPTRSYLSQSELAITFGLGTAETIDELKIAWPGGETSRIDPPPVNTTANVRQGDPPTAVARH